MLRRERARGSLPHESDVTVNGRAEVVVTFNRRDFEPAATPFGLEILVPADAVRRLENRS
jgi:hypothetical protein